MMQDCGEYARYVRVRLYRADRNGFALTNVHGRKVGISSANAPPQASVFISVSRNALRNHHVHQVRDFFEPNFP